MLDYRVFKVKIEFLVFGNYRLVCIRLVFVLIIIINFGDMGEWFKVDRCWGSFNYWEKGIILDKIYIFFWGYLVDYVIYSEKNLIRK